MVSDARAQQAREHHRASADLYRKARDHQSLRNRLVRQLRADDPERWTYAALARAVGCSPELVAAIIKERVPSDAPRTERGASPRIPREKRTPNVTAESTDTPDVIVDENKLVTVKLIPDAVKALNQAAQRSGMTRTDIINRALQAYDYIEGVAAKGGTIYVEEQPRADLKILAFN